MITFHLDCLAQFLLGHSIEIFPAQYSALFDLVLVVHEDAALFEGADLQVFCRLFVELEQFIEFLTV